MPLLFDAFNIFSRKSRLASCAVSLASASVAPKAPSPSATGMPSTLEVVAVPEDPQVCTVHVEVGAGGLECREMAVENEVGLEKKQSPVLSTRKPARNPRRPTARHALLKCSVSPPSSKQPMLRRSPTLSGIPGDSASSPSSGHRRKRSSSTSSVVADSVAFPSSQDEANTSIDGSGTPADGNGAALNADDAQPPRKRIRRSAVSVSRPDASVPPCPSISRCKQERSLSSSLGLDADPEPHSTSSEVSTIPPRTSSLPNRRRSPSPPVAPRINFTKQQRDLASLYHTLVVHHEITLPAAIEEQTARGLQRRSISSPHTLAQEELRDQDGILLTRIYLRLLLSRVPVAPLQHDRLRRTKEWEGCGLESGSIASDSPSLSSNGGSCCVESASKDCPGLVNEVKDVDSPWLGLDDGMDVDEARPLCDGPTDVAPHSQRPLSHASPSPSPPPSPEVPQWVGPPYPSLSHLVVDLTLRYRHRVSLDSRRRRQRPTMSRSQTKSNLGLASVTLEDLLREEARMRKEESRRTMDDVLDGMGMMDAERMDVDGVPLSAVRSTFVWSEADEEEVRFGREEIHRKAVEDCLKDPSELSPPAGYDGDSEFDSDEEEDQEWKRLRDELVASSASDTTSTMSHPIPIRPPSPVPNQLDSDDLGAPVGRHNPIRDVTNTGPPTRGNKSSASKLFGRIQKGPPSMRRPLTKIKYPEHALAVSR